MNNNTETLYDPNGNGDRVKERDYGETVECRKCRYLSNKSFYDGVESFIIKDCGHPDCFTDVARTVQNDPLKGKSAYTEIERVRAKDKIRFYFNKNLDCDKFEKKSVESIFSKYKSSIKYILLGFGIAILMVGAFALFMYFFLRNV